MRISTKGRYAIKLMLDLATNDNGEPIRLKDVARRQEISEKYLEQIIPMYNRSGILKTERGSQGGYQLAKSPETLTVGEILRFTEGDLAPVACAGEETPVCTRSADCAVLPVWQGLYRVINEYLDGITLQDIMDQHRANPADDYMI